MAIRKTLKSCCGKKALTLYFNVPFTKEHVSAFTQQGYTTSNQYTKAGMLHLKKDVLTVTSVFGSKRANIRCASQKCERLVDEFERSAEEILASTL